VLLFFIAVFITNPLSYHGEIKQYSDSVNNADTLFVAEGKTLYEAKCRKCHTLYKPGDYKLSQWKKNLKEMKYKAELNNDEYKKILAYLEENCKKK
jgi:cytochrome c5